MRCDRIDLGDIDNDGDLDLISGISENNGYFIGWLENPLPDENPGQLNGWTFHEIGSQEGYIKDIRVRDFNRDDKPDVVTRVREQTVIHFQESPQHWPQKKVMEHFSHEGMDIGDLDKDGDPDVVLNGFWYETPADAVHGEYIMHIIDNKWFTPIDSSWRDNNSSVKVADMNKDGILDILISHSELPGYPISLYAAGSVEDLLNDNWTESRIREQYDFCQTLDAGDVDNDGDMDVLAAKFQREPGNQWSNESPFPVTVFYNIDGDALTWKADVISVDRMYAGIFGDVGSDGDLDIIGPRSYYDGPLNMWENKLGDYGSSWGRVSASKDPEGNWAAVLENNKIAIRYGFKMSGDKEEGMITRFILKEFPEENIAGALLEASAHRGLISNAEVIKDSGDEKSIRLEWVPTPGSKDRHPGPAISEISIYPDRNYIRIIYKSFCFPHICDIASPGGMQAAGTESDCGGKYRIYGYENEDPPLYEKCLYWEEDGCIGCEGENAPPEGIAGDPSQLSYKGWFIMGVYYEVNQHGYGRIFPVENMRVIKLLWNKGFELFPKGENVPCYLFPVTGGGDEIIQTGKKLVDEIIQ